MVDYLEISQKRSTGERKNFSLGILAILIAALLWSTLGVMGKLFLKEGVDMIAGVSLRPFFAFLVLLTSRPLFHRGPSPEPYPPGKKIAFFALFGFVGVTIFYILYFLAVKVTSISLAVLLLYTAPVWVLIFSLVSRWESFSFQKGGAVILSLAGVSLIAQASFGNFSIMGFLYGLGSGLTYALFTYFGKIALKRFDLWSVLVWVFGFGSLGFLPFWIWRPELLLQVIQNPTALLIAFLMGLGPTAISYGAYLWALNFVPPTVAALICTLEPVLGSLWGVLFFSEAFTLKNALGGILVLSAVILASSGRKKGESLEKGVEKRGEIS
ncbi:MAG: DMT family transporter [Caldiserica bacterium]|jgi:drug/metabolite transporter (DMT)-like permease|nr:DMT family transporter [Caldisericota bacterium]MDH7562463.1 EamA family transporter [Caldisericota bacterium]